MHHLLGLNLEIGSSLKELNVIESMIEWSSLNELFYGVERVPFTHVIHGDKINDQRSLELSKAVNTRQPQTGTLWFCQRLIIAIACFVELSTFLFACWYMDFSGMVCLFTDIMVKLCHLSDHLVDNLRTCYMDIKLCDCWLLVDSGLVWCFVYTA